MTRRLPDPVVLFVVALALCAAASLLLAGPHPDTLDPRTGLPIVVVPLLRPDALATGLARVVPAFAGFPPLGVVIVTMLGVGVAERSGLVGAMLGAIVRATPSAWLTPAVILAGILSHVAADAGFVVVLPLAAIAFHAAGRHPMAGIAAAFAGVSGGFGANLVPGPIDPLLAGLTQQAARLVDPTYVLGPLGNLAFTASSAVVLIVVGWVITDRFVTPRLAHLVVVAPEGDSVTSHFPTRGVAVLVLIAALLLAAALPATSPLRDASHSLLGREAPLMAGLVPLLSGAAALAGIVHGFSTRLFRDHRDVVAAMEGAVRTLSGYVVLAFFAAIFLDAFDRSSLGIWLAVRGGDLLSGAGVGGFPALLGVIGFVALLNLTIASASAKWALLAPILVPVGIRLGLQPDLVQAAFRVGDGITNIVTPLMPYFPLVLATCRRWSPDADAGTLIGTMIPYSVGFGLAWTVVLWGFVALGLPLGW